MDYTDIVSLQKALSDVTNLLSNIQTSYCLLTTEETSRSASSSKSNQLFLLVTHPNPPKISPKMVHNFLELSHGRIYKEKNTNKRKTQHPLVGCNYCIISSVDDCISIINILYLLIFFNGHAVYSTDFTFLDSRNKQ